MTVGSEAGGLGPGHIVLDGYPAPLPQKGRAPNFRSIFSERLFAVARPSVACRLPVCLSSVVCNVRAPYSGG